ncbi:hypothetical protein [Roseovarius sp. 2305UL8-3]|uniref:hypothetical protein n=1 Tax=Roseovarius conchicola TaxID=3121636 RepID=UPI003527B410
MDNSWDHRSTGPHYTRKTKVEPIKRRCHLCMGTGMAPCQVCLGKGEVVNGRDVNGRARFVPCVGCIGKKTLRCRHCNGIGML